eukprot:1235354-Rhodomonas_salina.1
MAGRGGRGGAGRGDRREPDDGGGGQPQQGGRGGAAEASQRAPGEPGACSLVRLRGVGCNTRSKVIAGTRGWDWRALIRFPSRCSCAHSQNSHPARVHAYMMVLASTASCRSISFMVETQGRESNHRNHPLQLDDCHDKIQGAMAFPGNTADCH